jgi:ATP-dependent exoDNAse (exonuclease V) beta subunit
MRFGDLVHSLLQLAPLGEAEPAARDESLAELAQLQGRVLGASHEETLAAAAAVAAALESTVMTSLLDAEEFLREVPFALRLDDGRTLEGVFDLLVRSAEGWTVVDFKTDVDLESRRAHYERQLSWYLYALEQLTGSSVRGMLLRV